MSAALSVLAILFWLSFICFCGLLGYCCFMDLWNRWACERQDKNRNQQTKDNHENQ